MGLSDRDYMRDRARRAADRERANDELLTWPPKPWVVITAAAILAVLTLVYVF